MYDSQDTTKNIQQEITRELYPDRTFGSCL